MLTPACLFQNPPRSPRAPLPLLSEAYQNIVTIPVSKQDDLPQLSSPGPGLTGGGES